MQNYFKAKNRIYRIDIDKQPNYQGGSIIIERLIGLLRLRTRIQLGEIIGVTPGTLSTWQTRTTTPFESLIKIHLATNIPLEFLCFGQGGDVSDFVIPFEKKEQIYENIKKIPKYDGGKILIERLMRTYEVWSRIELADLIGHTAGTMSTWTTRSTTPYEILIRTHLAIGVSMKFLCFGDKESPEQQVIQKEIPEESAETLKLPILEIKSIENGNLNTIDKIRTDCKSYDLYGILPRCNDFALKYENKILFINCRVTQVSKGKYLFSTNGVYQLGYLRLMLDGEVYLVEGEDKYQINSAITKIHGRVTAAIENY